MVAAMAGYIRVQSSPVRGQEPKRAPIQPRPHPVAVELDFMEPLGPVRRRVDQFGELRLNRRRQSGGLGAQPPPRDGVIAQVRSSAPRLRA